MTGREIIDRAKNVTSVSKVGEDILFDALERIEIMIEKYLPREHREFKKDEKLLAAGGGVTDGYDEMYEAYVKREAAKAIEDWDCFEKYDAIYLARWAAFREEIVRTQDTGEKRIKQDWNWR